MSQTNDQTKYDCERSFIEYTDKQLALVRENFVVAQRDCGVDAVHDMRVAFKRLRAVYDLVEGINPSFDRKQYRRRFRKLFKSAGKVRDAQVMQELIREFTEDTEHNLSEFYNYCKRLEVAARPKFLDRAEKFDSRELSASGQEIADALDGYEPNIVAFRTEMYMNASLDELVEYVLEPDLNPTDMHQIRILTKATRYVVEILQTCQPDRNYLQKLNSALRDVHRALGVWHDAEVSLSQLTSFLRDEAVSPLFDPDAYKAFGRHLESERDSNLQRFQEVWKQHGDLFQHREQIATSL